jgi:hypothetical protein
MQAFFKGMVYNQLNKDSLRLNDKSIRELDFVIKCGATANNILKEKEKESGVVDFKEAQKEWNERYKQLLDAYLKGTLKLAVAETPEIEGEETEEETVEKPEPGAPGDKSMEM